MRNRKGWLIWVWAVIGFWVVMGSAWAEEASKGEAPEVVVTATRVPQPVSEAPGSVSVVTKKEMEKRNIYGVDEALNVIPGVFNRRGKGLMDTLARVTLRGIPGQEKTLVLLDGIPLNNAYYGGVRWIGVAPENVERIEVAKGPFSSLYGGNAMGGVINIITKLPKKREFLLKSSYGSGFDRGEAMDDLRKVYLSYGDRIKDRLSFLLSYKCEATNGYPTNFNVQRRQPPAGVTGWSYTEDPEGHLRYLIGDKGDNTWWDDNIGLKVGYEFSKDTKILFSFLRSRYEYDYDDPHTYLRDFSGNEVWSYDRVRESSFLSGSGGEEQNLYALRYETKFSFVKTKLTLGLLDVGKDWWTSPSGKATRSGGLGKINNTPCENYYVDIQFSFPLFERHLLTFGGSFRHGWANSKKYKLRDWKDDGSKTKFLYQAKGKDRTYAFFVQDRITVLDNLMLYLGFREDWWETYDGYVNQVGTAGYPKEYGSRHKSAFSPKAAIIYIPFENTILRASVGKAFRPPTIYELYKTWTSSWSGRTYAGNPDLKPETTASWDIGFVQRLWKGFRIEATYFENHMKDLIYLTKISKDYYKKTNAGKARSRGIEIGIEQDIDKWLKIFANFTYTDAKITENDAKPETEGKRLTSVPQKMFNLGVEFERGSFFGSIIGRYVGKRYSDDENKDKVNHVFGSYDPYFVVDAKLSYKITKFATFSFSINNLFDRDYYCYYKAPGRTWFAELKFEY